ncbi:MAG: VCBS repeat-containing protein [Pyrinomonadaceae bacterium]
MKSIKIALLFLLFIGLAAPVWRQISAQNESKIKQDPKIKEFVNGSEERESEEEEEDADLPAGVKINKEEYLSLRNEHLDILRGFDTAQQDSRAKSIMEMERSERILAQKRISQNRPLATLWNPLGPAPIPISASTAYSGRTSAIAVHPTNPNIVYAGTAQGGLYRTLNGGTTWTPLLDSALTIAVGAVAISPSDPTTIFVGTGESTLCGSGCFIGVGLYRITNADTTPILSPVLNKDSLGNDVFTGRAVSEIIVHPTDSNTLFVGTTSGVAGIGQQTTGLVLPSAGIYRTTNALGANPTFEKLTIQGTLGASRSVTDLAIEPGNPNRLIAGVVGSGGDGGIYLSTDALAATPTFARSQALLDGANPGRVELAVNKNGAVVTVYAATGFQTTGQNNGTIFKSVDGGASFTAATGALGFCTTQCFYDIAVAVDPVDANKLFIGGSPTRVFNRSADGGATYTTNAQSATNLHVDSQVITLAPSDSNIAYFGSDGGIWKTTNVNATPVVWTTLNNSTYSATQFMGLTLHPLDRHYALGGTQDNGTEFLAPNGTTWVNSDGGDGGFAAIDRNATTPNDVVAYHTYFNQTTTQVGFERALTTEASGDPTWATFQGCRNGVSNNGILCTDAVLFYAPLVVGPGNPSTVYYGSNRLYRSIDRGTTMTQVSQGLTGANERVSAIGIAPQDDNVRLIGSTLGRVYLSTTAGATTMTDVTGAIPARYIGRIVVDPTNTNIAYVALNGFGIPNQHVFKTTNLLSGTPTWTASGTGIPDTPTNVLAIDPSNPQIVFAGTDIGVFRTANGGTSWEPFSDGLPRVAVFGMEIQAVHRILKIATHGRGMWEKNLAVANRRTIADFDGDGKTDLSIFRPSEGNWYVKRSTDGVAQTVHFGLGGDTITPGDYDGDGKTDYAIFRSGTWYVFNSASSTIRIENFGLATDTPVANDYDGDSKTDLAVYRAGIWYYLRSGSNTFNSISFGLATDTPQPGDYDGDGKSDPAVYRASDDPANADFYIFKSSDATTTGYSWGLTGDIPAAADYDGDSVTDVAVFRPSSGDWYVLKSLGGFTIMHFGLNGDLPQHGDYDGDAKSDFAVYRPSDGTWYVLNSTTGVPTIEAFGMGTDTPVPARQNP